MVIPHTLAMRWHSPLRCTVAVTTGEPDMSTTTTKRTTSTTTDQRAFHRWYTLEGGMMRAIDAATSSPDYQELSHEAAGARFREALDRLWQAEKGAFLAA